MPYFDRDGLKFHYRSEGQGIPVVWQHGLGSDVDKTFALLDQPTGFGVPGFRFVGFDARAHGDTRPLGDPKQVAIAVTADDLKGFLDGLGITRAVIGGISMGAAVALNFATRYPQYVMGLILSRPAWLDRPLPDNLRLFPHIAQFLLRHGPREGLERFRQTAEFQALLRDSPDCAQVVVNNFEDPRAEECVVRLERIPHDAPSHDSNEWRSLRVPTLILANRQDPIHPRELAETLASILPEAELREITPKSVSVDRHAEDVRNLINGFLTRHFPETRAT